MGGDAEVVRVPLVNPVAVPFSAFVLLMVVHGPSGLAARCARYSSTVAPPLLEGVSQVSLTLALLGTAVGDLGAIGTVRGTALTAVLDGAQPAALWATTRK
jgi:hypothetical protein